MPWILFYVGESPDVKAKKGFPNELICNMPPIQWLKRLFGFSWQLHSGKQKSFILKINPVEKLSVTESYVTHRRLVRIHYSDYMHWKKSFNQSKKYASWFIIKYVRNVHNLKRKLANSLGSQWGLNFSNLRVQKCLWPRQPK